MKRISLVFLCATLFAAAPLAAQDAATQERLDRLAGQIEDVIATQRAQQKQLEALAKEIDALREQASRHSGGYATQEDAKRLAEAINQVDRKRIEDAERVSTQLDNLRKTLTASPPSSRTRDIEKAANEKGYSYTIQQGDTLSMIVQAYREKNIKVTTDQILKANPGLKPERMTVGTKIWIPAP